MPAPVVKMVSHFKPGSGKTGQGSAIGAPEGEPQRLAKESGGGGAAVAQREIVDPRDTQVADRIDAVASHDPHGALSALTREAPVVPQASWAWPAENPSLVVPVSSEPSASPSEARTGVSMMQEPGAVDSARQAAAQVISGTTQEQVGQTQEPVVSEAPPANGIDRVLQNAIGDVTSFVEQSRALREGKSDIPGNTAESSQPAPVADSVDVGANSSPVNSAPEPAPIAPAGEIQTTSGWKQGLISEAGSVTAGKEQRVEEIAEAMRRKGSSEEDIAKMREGYISRGGEARGDSNGGVWVEDHPDALVASQAGAAGVVAEHGSMFGPSGPAEPPKVYSPGVYAAPVEASVSANPTAEVSLPVSGMTLEEAQRRGSAIDGDSLGNKPVAEQDGSPYAASLTGGEASSTIGTSVPEADAARAGGELPVVASTVGLVDQRGQPLSSRVAVESPISQVSPSGLVDTQGNLLQSAEVPGESSSSAGVQTNESWRQGLIDKHGSVEAGLQAGAQELAESMRRKGMTEEQVSKAVIGYLDRGQKARSESSEQQPGTSSSIQPMEETGGAVGTSQSGRAISRERVREQMGKDSTLESYTQASSSEMASDWRNQGAIRDKEAQIEQQAQQEQALSQKRLQREQEANDRKIGTRLKRGWESITGRKQKDQVQQSSQPVSESARVDRGKVREGIKTQVESARQDEYKPSRDQQVQREAQRLSALGVETELAGNEEFQAVFNKVYESSEVGSAAGLVNRARSEYRDQVVRKQQEAVAAEAAERQAKADAVQRERRNERARARRVERKASGGQEAAAGAQAATTENSEQSYRDENGLYKVPDTDSQSSIYQAFLAEEAKKNPDLSGRQLQEAAHKRFLETRANQPEAGSPASEATAAVAAAEATIAEGRQNGRAETPVANEQVQALTKLIEQQGEKLAQQGRLMEAMEKRFLAQNEAMKQMAEEMQKKDPKNPFWSAILKILAAGYITGEVAGNLNEKTGTIR